MLMNWPKVGAGLPKRSPMRVEDRALNNYEGNSSINHAYGMKLLPPQKTNKQPQNWSLKLAWAFWVSSVLCAYCHTLMTRGQCGLETGKLPLWKSPDSALCLFIWLVQLASVRVNIRTAMLAPYPFPIVGSLLEAPYHLLESSYLGPKNDRNPSYAIVTRGKILNQLT
jgi:hypothetical protein